MDRVIIKDLVARGIIGVNDWEREKAQDILINIVVFTDTLRASRTDDLGDCVNYRTLAQRARLHAETAARFTVEALANDLAGICLEDKAVQKVLVRVEKPGAVRFSASVGVEIERSRDDLTNT
jgi:FolB domain-containing protein